MRAAAFWYSPFSLVVVRATGKELRIEWDKTEKKIKTFSMEKKISVLHKLNIVLKSYQS